MAESGWTEFICCPIFPSVFRATKYRCNGLTEYLSLYQTITSFEGRSRHVTALLASTAISVCINIYKSEVFFVKYSTMIYYGTRSVDETQIIIKSKGDRL